MFHITSSFKNAFLEKLKPIYSFQSSLHCVAAGSGSRRIHPSHHPSILRGLEMLSSISLQTMKQRSSLTCGSLSFKALSSILPQRDVAPISKMALYFILTLRGSFFHYCHIFENTLILLWPRSSVIQILFNDHDFRSLGWYHHHSLLEGHHSFSFSFRVHLFVMLTKKKGQIS